MHELELCGTGMCTDIVVGMERATLRFHVYTVEDDSQIHSDLLFYCTNALCCDLMWNRMPYDIV